MYPIKKEKGTGKGTLVTPLPQGQGLISESLSLISLPVYSLSSVVLLPNLGLLARVNASLEHAIIAPATPSSSLLLAGSSSPSPPPRVLPADPDEL